MDYIPINSVNDIDTKKISVREINKRYIDRDGNRFATRFNLQKRRIEVVRLARNQQEASNIRGAILQEKKVKKMASKTKDKPDNKTTSDIVSSTKQHESQNPPISQPNLQKPEVATGSIEEFGLDDSDFLEEQNAAITSDFTVDATNMLEQPFLEETSKELERYKERQQIVLNQLKDLPKDLLRPQILADLTREIDVKCWQESEKCVNYFKELYGYPRTISQYLNRLEDDEKAQIEQMENDKARMDTIKRIESSRTFTRILNTFLFHSKEIKKILDSIPKDELLQAMSGKKKQMGDLETTVNLLVQNTTQKLAEMKSWSHKYAVIRM